MAILKLKPRHACEGRSITAVLAECIDYSKAEYSKRTSTTANTICSVFF